MKHKWFVAIFLTVLCTAAFAEDILPEHITKWTGDSYRGSIHLTFNHDYGVISAKLETDNLLLVSLSADQLENYAGDA